MIFRLGDKVIARQHSALDVVYEGELIAIKDKNLICIQFKDDFVGKFDNKAYRVEFDFSRALYIRLHFAIDMAINLFGMRILNPKEVIVREKPLLDVHLSKKQNLKLVENGKRLKWYNKSLNDNQKVTVANTLRGDMLNPTVIHGPPGKIIHSNFQIDALAVFLNGIFILHMSMLKPKEREKQQH